MTTMHKLPEDKTVTTLTVFASFSTARLEIREGGGKNRDELEMGCLLPSCVDKTVTSRMDEVNEKETLGS